MVFRQAREDAKLSIEQDTGEVPSDGKYYVVLDGGIQGSYRSLKKAQQRYREILSGLDLPRSVDTIHEEHRQAMAEKAIADSIADSMEMETFANSKAGRVKRGRTRTFG